MCVTAGCVAGGRLRAVLLPTLRGAGQAQTGSDPEHVRGRQAGRQIDRQTAEEGSECVLLPWVW